MSEDESYSLHRFYDLLRHTQIGSNRAEEIFISLVFNDRRFNGSSFQETIEVFHDCYSTAVYFRIEELIIPKKRKKKQLKRLENKKMKIAKQELEYLYVSIPK